MLLLSIHLALLRSASLSPPSITTHTYFYTLSDRNVLDLLRHPPRYVQQSSSTTYLPRDKSSHPTFPFFSSYALQNGLTSCYIHITNNIIFLKVVNFVLYAGFKWLVKYPLPDGPCLRSCLKRPAKEPEPTFLDPFKGFAKTVRKTVRKTALVVTGNAKKVKIQATPTNSRVVFRWIDKKKDCFHRAKKRRQVPKRLATRR